MEENTNQTTQSASQQVIEQIPQTQKLPGDEILFGTLSYFNIAVLATLVSKPNSEFCKFHAKQGVTLLVFDLALLVVVSLALVIVPFFAFLLFFLGLISLFTLHIMGIVHAVQGKMYQLPVIYGLSQKIDVTHFFTQSKVQQVAQPHMSEPVDTQVAQPVQPAQPAQPVPTASETTETTQPAKPIEPMHQQSHGQDMVDRAVDEVSRDKDSNI